MDSHKHVLDDGIIYVQTQGIQSRIPNLITNSCSGLSWSTNENWQAQLINSNVAYILIISHKN